MRAMALTNPAPLYDGAKAQSVLKNLHEYEGEGEGEGESGSGSGSGSEWRGGSVFLSPSPFKSEGCGKMKAPKISIMREEFVDLTQDPLMAMVLNQLLYWSQRVKDLDLYLEEEKTSTPECKRPPQHGWFYKSATELSEETLLRVTKVTMRKYLTFLIEKGWISERSNPKNKWDRTTQYRVNLKQLQFDLNKLGWNLPGFSKDMFAVSEQKIFFEGKKKSFPKNRQNSACLENDTSKETFSTFDGRLDDTSKVEKLNFIYLTETTSKNTNKEHTRDAGARDPFDKMFEIWKGHVGQDALQLTETRKRQLQSILSLHFQNDIQQWEEFCIRVKSSPFLMGGGSRKWHVTLDWILEESNLLKVLEGNFDNPKVLEQEKAITIKATRDKEKADILASIFDPLWREWCSRLDTSFDSRDSISLWELQEIANARFLEIDDKHLVWVGSSDKHALDRIENLRLKLVSIIERTFPNMRNLRTRLDEGIPILSHTSSPLNTPNKGVENHD